MTIEQYLEIYLQPKKWNGDKPTMPVLAETLGDGKLLAEVTPINSRPESWYIRIDSSYVSMSDSEQDEYEDEIHAQIESNFERKWLRDEDKEDKETMRMWTKQEKKRGYKNYPAYEWDGGSVEILNVNEFIQEKLIGELLKIGYELSSYIAKYSSEKGVVYAKNNIEFHLFDDWFIVYISSEHKYHISYENCEVTNLMEFIANEILENSDVYILDIPKNIYDLKYLTETWLPFSNYEVKHLFEGIYHVTTEAKANYLVVGIDNSAYFLIDCEITDIEAVQLLIDTQASKEVFAKTFADMITDYDTCIVCKFKENEFTEAFKINSQLAILFL